MMLHAPQAPAENFRAKVQPFGSKAWSFIVQPPERDRKYTLMVGSVRSAKTWAVTGKLILHLCRYRVDGRRVIIGKSKGKVHKNILIDLFEIIGKDKYTYNQSTGELWLFLGENQAPTQWFVIGANDEASYTNILGMTIGICIGDEVIEWPRSFFMQLLLRLSPSGARFYGTTNPGPPSHYLKTEFIDKVEIQPDLKHLTFTFDDNPNLSEEAKRTLKASQSGVFYLRYILGKWVMAEGAIYGTAWDDAALLYTPEQIGPRLYGFGGYVDHIIFVDYGTANPFTALEAIDDGKTLWIDRQYWWDSFKEARQKTDGQYKDDLVAWLSAEGYKRPDGMVSVSRVQRRDQPRFVVDPSAASFRTELSAAGFWVVDANNDVADGIRRTDSVLTQRLVRINRECEDLIRELPSYMWDPDALKRGEEQPIKANDHGCVIGTTPVLTGRGWKPIREIVAGETVATRKGFREVLDAAMTNRSADVLRVLMTNRQRLTGTADHPVWVEGKGFVRLDSLQSGDVLLTNPSQPHHPAVLVLGVRRLKQRQAVYNLTVDGDEHEYFASGVLIHNCDALRYGVEEIFSDFRLMS